MHFFILFNLSERSKLKFYRRNSDVDRLKAQSLEQPFEGETEDIRKYFVNPIFKGYYKLPTKNFIL